MIGLQQATFVDFIEAIPQIVWMSLPDGTTDYFNHLGTDYTGLPAEANYGWGWLELIHQQDAMQARRAWDHATRTATPYEMQYRLRRRDGQYLWHDARAMPVRGRGRTIERWVGTVVDIDHAVRLTGRVGKIERQAADALAVLETVPRPDEQFGFVEQTVRAIRVNALLAQDRGRDGSRDGARSKQSPPDTGDADLSAAEMEVVRLIALGYTNKEAANRLAVSLRTVEGRRARAQQKLGAHSRAQLFGYAHRCGLVD